MKTQTNWVIFDGDNTLWLIEQLYDDARINLCEYLAARGCDKYAVELFQRERDKELYATYGYSACRFARSFEDTAIQFLPQITPKDVQHIRNFALEVFERKAKLPDGLEELLKELSREYSLGIITAGEMWVQKLRLEHFHLTNLFSAIDIVETKNAVVFEVFCQKHKIDTSKSWMVGDSVNSDVIPANAIGLNSVHLIADNWGVIEGKAEHLPIGAIQIKNLLELRDYLL